MLFQPSYAHRAASIARPNAAAPPPGALEGVARCAQSAVFDHTAMPSTTIAMPATLRTVSAVWTRPPTTTVRQLMMAKNTIAAIATTCVRPNCQCIVLPSAL